MRGYGYTTVTQQMLFDVFDRQLNHFIKDYRAANPNPMTVASATPNAPAQTRESSNSLLGLNGISLFVSFQRNQFADERRIHEHQKIFQKEEEAKLVQAGIALLRYVNDTEQAGCAL